ncbi:MAG: succinate dehydrogenase, hydrophobic membrane anchor protein [Hyphomicrobiales bacterium]|nr:succinate dehydrogenase, hydrophobic membrane anchor protein [Hyphomicrobiales bacterium]
MSYRSPLGRARGLGAAKTGVAHWWHQRVTAIANIVLVLWLIWSFSRLDFTDYDAIYDWMSFPFNALMLIFLIGNVFYHGYLGIKVVIEDYSHCECGKMTAILVALYGLTLTAGVGIFSVLTVYFLG